MIFKQSNRTDPEAVFIVCRNITGATVSAGAPVQWDVVTATDGNAVTQSKSADYNPAGLFAGVNDAALADSAYGLVQVYGFRTSAYCSGGTAGDCVAGAFLAPTSGYLDHATMSAATTSGHVFVSLMETLTTTTLTQASVFIRAL